MSGTSAETRSTRLRHAQDLDVLLERRRVVDEAEGVARTLIRRDVAPPEHRPAGLDAGRRHVAQPIHGRGAGRGGERPVVPRVEHAIPDPRDRPARLGAPPARSDLEKRPRRVPVSDVHRQARLLHDPRVFSLEPLVVPADGLAAPVEPGLRIRLVRPGVVPRADDRLDRRLHVLEHPRNAVAVAVVPAADEKARDLDRVVSHLQGRAVPERAVALLRLVGAASRAAGRSAPGSISRRGRSPARRASRCRGPGSSPTCPRA